MRISALIVAAGQSSRMGEGVPKPYLPLGGKTVLAHSVETFLSHPAIDEVQVVINAAHDDLYQNALEGYSINVPVYGGASRSESVLNGLRALTSDYVLIHDAARPFVTNEIIDRIIDKLDEKRGIAVACPVVDTLRLKDGSGDIDRDNVMRVQTPQAFSVKALIEAYEKVGTGFTDDASAFEAAGGTIMCVEGAETLFKITTEADYKRAQQMTSQNIVKTGLGFDVHKFADSGDHVMLGGVKVPHTNSLEGHSDADVVLHALTDAMLGTIGAGDIGEHFPPSDPQWKGAASSRFVEYAFNLLAKEGGRISNVDVTVICEAPKLSDYKADMCAHIGGLLGLENAHINIKATTTEGLGFTGRNEGVAAQVLVTVAF